MSVTLSWNEDNAGTEITQPLDHGTVSGNATSSGVTTYLEHNGINPLTLCYFYIAGTDAAEILSWGDDGTGGFQLNMDAENDFPDGSWVTLTTSGGGSADNAVILDSRMNLTNTGIIPAGINPNVRFQSRLQIPASGVSVGTYVFDQKMKYTSTS